MYNPRFPHILKILKPRMNGGFFSNDSSEDFDRNAVPTPVVDENGNPIYDYMIFNVVCEIDGEPVLDEDGKFITEESDFINCGYRTETQSTKTEGDVIVEYTKLSTPLFTNEINYGYIAEITDQVRTFRATIVRKQMTTMGTQSLHK